MYHSLSKLTKSKSGEEAKPRGFVVGWVFFFFLSLQGPLTIFQDSFSYTGLSVESARWKKATETVRKPISSKNLESQNILSRLLFQKEALKHVEAIRFAI